MNQNIFTESDSNDIVYTNQRWDQRSVIPIAYVIISFQSL